MLPSADPGPEGRGEREQDCFEGNGSGYRSIPELTWSHWRWSRVVSRHRHTLYLQREGRERERERERSTPYWLAEHMNAGL